MRLSTAQIFQQGVSAMQRQQVGMARTQEQVATGERVLTPADDPVAATRIIDLKQTISLVEQYGRNADSANSRLALEDSTVGSVGDILQRVHELALQGNNGTFTSSDRQAIALEVEERLTELLGLANTKDANNEYLFAGNATRTAPFSRVGSNFVYSGDQGQRRLEIGPGYQVPVGDPGSDVFQAIRNGNGTFVNADNAANAGTGVIDQGTVVDTSAWVPDVYTINFTSTSTYEVLDSSSNTVTTGGYTSGQAIQFNGIQVIVSGAPALGDSFTVSPSANQDLFATVQSLVDALAMPQSNAVERAKFQNTIIRVLADMGQADDHMSTLRASVGARLNAVANEKAANENFGIQLDRTLSEVKDVDLTEAISEFTQHLTALQAAQQAFVQVRDMSLFNFL